VVHSRDEEDVGVADEVNSPKTIFLYKVHDYNYTDVWYANHID